jgi:hypothetical protein
MALAPVNTLDSNCAFDAFPWRLDNQQNDIQHNDTQHSYTQQYDA